MLKGNSKRVIWVVIGMGFLLVQCTGLERSEREKLRAQNMTEGYINRYHDEVFHVLRPPKPKEHPPYPWEEGG